MFNPIKFGENLKLDLALSYIRFRGLAVKNFIEKLVPEDSNHTSFKEKLEEFIKVKGPFIQALDLPLYSKNYFEYYARNLTLKYAPNGLWNELIQTLIEFGIERLYDFQEKTINEMLSKLDNYLITAPTGRGKTEAWLIPLLNFIISIKKGKNNLSRDKNFNRTKTKVVLLYPTKALAQDQFKRLINYLSVLNHKMNPDKRISIGIYDGDTPYKRNPRIREILTSTFALFSCPLFDITNSDCSRECNNLVVKNDIPANETSRRPHIVLSREACERKIDFSFIYLTREDIEDNGVDILITNPDELNVQLININNLHVRDIFLIDPLFFVLDEVHTYSGIFGSYLSMIIKRIRVCRSIEIKNKDLAQFYLIGASATIGNKEELFSRISGKNERDFVIIDAKSYKLTLGEKKSLLEKDKKILMLLCKENDLIKNLKKIEKIDPSFLISSIESDSSDKIQNFLYNYFLSKKNLNILSLLMRLLHIITNKTALTQSEIINKIRGFLQGLSYEINEEYLQNLFDNLYSFGTYSGFIESRSHLFVWPIDGFYGCINCGKIYQNLRAACDTCGEDFITKVLYCSRCSDIFYESWYCPECHNLHPSQINNEGLFNRFDSFYCLYEHESKVECSKVIWKPNFKCRNCKAIYQKRNIPNCPNCIKIVPLELMLSESKGKYYFCKKCGESFDYASIEEREKICYTEDCQNPLKLLQMKNSNGLKKKCDCEKIDTDDNICSICGEKIEQKKILPWICKNCGKKYFTKKPPRGSCEKEGCRSQTFYLDGFFEPSIFYEEFESPSKQYLKKSDLESKYKIKRISLKNYAYINQKFQIVKKSIGIKSSRFFFDGKCNIKRSFSNRRIGRRFIDITYTPNFTSSRISQFLLKQFFRKDENFNKETALRNSKILSFADSVRDMNLLAENFFESEVVLFIDQLIYDTLKNSENNTLSLKILQEKVFNALEEYLLFISEGNPQIQNNIKFKFRKALRNSHSRLFNYFVYFKEDLSVILDEIIRQIVLNKDNIRRLVLEGILDYDIKIDFNNLTNNEIELFKRIKTHHNYPPSFKSLSYIKIKENLSEIEYRRERLEKTDPSERDRIKALNDEIKEENDKIDLKQDNIEAQLDGLVDKNYLIKKSLKSTFIYYINPELIFINLVSNKNPVYYNKEKEEFFSKFEHRFLSNSEERDLTLFDKNIEDRLDLMKPAFSQVAYLLETFYPSFFNSEAYKGETTPIRRRRMEGYFRNGMSLNYISSGPAMEVGINIGDLNIMLLYGTPPNVNSYLQRIGRAGRKMKKSLIVSVSKRNPIDYYYYQRPSDLMKQSEQPVPINDKNPRVIRNSLVWALLDYITNNYIIEWESDTE